MKKPTPEMIRVLVAMDRGEILQSTGIGVGRLVDGTRVEPVGAATVAGLIRRFLIRRIGDSFDPDTLMCRWTLTFRGLRLVEARAEISS